MISRHSFILPILLWWTVIPGIAAPVRLRVRGVELSVPRFCDHVDCTNDGLPETRVTAISGRATAAGAVFRDVANAQAPRTDPAPSVPAPSADSLDTRPAAPAVFQKRGRRPAVKTLAGPSPLRASSAQQAPAPLSITDFELVSSGSGSDSADEGRAPTGLGQALEEAGRYIRHNSFRSPRGTPLGDAGLQALVLARTAHHMGMSEADAARYVAAQGPGAEDSVAQAAAGAIAALKNRLGRPGREAAAGKEEVGQRRLAWQLANKGEPITSVVKNALRRTAPLRVPV